MSWTKKIKNPRSVLEIGQEVDVVVSEVDPEKRRLSLSLRAIEPNPWETVADTYQIGGRIGGVVRNLTDFGAFVEIVPGVDGLVHISDMSWTRRINHPSEVVQKGQEVNAVITAMDVHNQRISLSMKELLPNEWEEYANSHGVGDLVTGAVTNITDFGVFIELSPGVEGLCHISEIDRDAGMELAEVFTQGQKVRSRILRIDWNESRIGLSMHGVGQSEAEEEYEAQVGTGAGADTAMAAALRAGGIVAEEEAAAADEGEPSAAEAVEAAVSETVEEAVTEEAVTEEAVTEEAVTEEAVEEPIEAVADQPEAEEEVAEAQEDAAADVEAEAAPEPEAETEAAPEPEPEPEVEAEPVETAPAVEEAEESSDEATTIDPGVDDEEKPTT